MMKTIFKVLLLFVSCLMLACTDLDELLSGDDVHNAILRFEGGIEGYDVKTRATTSVWPDGARIYVQYQTDNGVKNGSAVYRRSSDTWTFTYNGTLTQGKAMSCSVYYFENPSSMTATDAILNAQSATYADAEASYFSEDGTITIHGILKPLLGRIRFKGTAGTSFTLSGLKWYTGYSNASNSLSQQSGTLSLTVGSNGYTPYIYAQFADASARTLSLTYLSVTYTQKFADKVLALGRSGYLNIPSETSLQGWTQKKGTNKYPVESIDLGLNSGLLWATYNLGAEGVYENGLYLAWADPEEKTTCTRDYPMLVETYPVDIAGTEYDVVTHILGDGWHMPNEWDFLELKENCKWSILHINGIWGIQGVGPNGNKIFLPMGGNRQGDGSMYQTGSETAHGYGYYWTSEGTTGLDANYFTFPNTNKALMRIAETRKWLGMFIRPVKGQSNTEDTYHGGGDQGGYISEFDQYAVDLGLSSSWASINIGATKPSQLGSAFAWGETEPRTTFTSENYQLYKNGVVGDYLLVDTPISGTDYDAAHCIWGGEWEMPSEIDFLELFEGTTWKWETLDGIGGFRVTSKVNGNSIFLPSNEGLGQYWSSTLYTLKDGFYNKYAFLIRFQEKVIPSYCIPDIRYQGMQIRPVKRKRHTTIATPNTLSFVTTNLAEKVVTVTSNEGWTATSNAAWCKVSPASGTNNGSVTVTVTANLSSSSRMANVTIKGTTSGDATTINIMQSGGNNGNSQTFTVNGVSFKMIKVEAGTFQMGEKGWATPVHQVTLTYDYYIGETEVTQELWTAVMGSNPSNFTSSNKLPVEYVSWDDCQTFITKLNELTGRSFRLPTEAEWEFAARGGNASKGYTYSGSNVVDDVAWYDYISSSKTHEVATKVPNELGIYNMSGNVWEWCQDRYGSYSSSAQTNPTGPTSGSYHVNRGGSWYYNDSYCRVAYRNWLKASLTTDDLGLRLAL